MKVSKYILAGSLLSAALLLTSPSVKANYYTGGFATGFLTYGVGSGGSSSIASTAAQQWNGVSSKVSLSYSSASNQYGSTANIVTYFNSDPAPTTDDYGITYAYSSYTGTSATPAYYDGLWVKAICFQYTNSALNTTTRKTGTATHELGHALSLDHAYEVAVMQQGVKDFYTLKSYDINNLKWKWGN
ncbi:zinc-dependent metalloprotease family protein [Paenibacillus sp. FSL R7-0331]|uniref:zinc-dependent metalloprotease family protein n=1 Tax=Paenibacillus sp. FSL R7-0331 TaxID=1536773 RepID=UPI0004F8EFAA|nr:zinc-dependent metalloprotease family protein [Paenibacillus sp. FSL R7-0331]AIQ54058.1 hypothetical protein R70331_22675 [Paenibacillus sp. FSL R7-0331]